ncbi:MAG: homoserine kinase [Rhodospirillales bacterium]|nr:homoserine kinase [Rhodospirillales bacterium]
MAVYTEVPDEMLEDFVAEYDIGHVVSFKGIAEGVENSNYLLQTDRANYILTLYEKRVNPDDLPFFLGLMDHLAARGIPCPTPIHGRDGSALRRLADRPAAIISFLQGIARARPSPRDCAQLGTHMAHLHLAGADYKPSRGNTLSVNGWRPLFNECAARVDEIQPGLADLILAELEYLENGWPVGLESGVIHADLFADNVFFLGDELSGLIDFYFACNDFLSYDLAVCLNAWCFEADGAFNITKARMMLSSYGKVRSLTDEELHAMPMLARGAAMRFLLTRIYDWLNQVEGALVRPKNPLEFLTRLRFHQGVSGPGAYGIG